MKGGQAHRHPRDAEDRPAAGRQDLDQTADVELAGDAVVSMNFWGFMPSIFDELETYFYDFLRSPEAQTAKAGVCCPTWWGICWRRAGCPCRC